MVRSPYRLDDLEAELDAIAASKAKKNSRANSGEHEPPAKRRPAQQSDGPPDEEPVGMRGLRLVDDPCFTDIVKNYSQLARIPDVADDLAQVMEEAMKANRNASPLVPTLFAYTAAEKAMQPSLDCWWALKTEQQFVKALKERDVHKTAEICEAHIFKMLDNLADVKADEDQGRQGLGGHKGGGDHKGAGGGRTGNNARMGVGADGHRSGAGGHNNRRMSGSGSSSGHVSGGGRADGRTGSARREGGPTSNGRKSMSGGVRVDRSKRMTGGDGGRVGAGMPLGGGRNGGVPSGRGRNKGHSGDGQRMDVGRRGGARRGGGGAGGGGQHVDALVVRISDMMVRDGRQQVLELQPHLLVASVSSWAGGYQHLDRAKVDYGDPHE